MCEKMNCAGNVARLHRVRQSKAVLRSAGLVQEDTAGLNCVLEDELCRKCLLFMFIYLLRLLLMGKQNCTPQSDAAGLLYAGAQD